MTMRHRLSWLLATCALVGEVNSLFAGSGLQQGELVIARNRNSVIRRYDGTSGALIADFVPDTGGLHFANDARIGLDGSIYVASSGSGRVSRYDGTTGAFISVVVPYGTGGLHEPYYLVIGPTADIYVLHVNKNTFAQQILRFDSSGTPLGTATLTPESFSGGITIAPNGDLLVATYSGASYRVRRFDSTSLADLGDFIPVGGGLLGRAVDLHFRPDGYLYVAHLGSPPGIRRFDAVTGTFVDVLVPSTPPGSGRMAFDAMGDLHIANPINGDIRRYSGMDGTPLGVFVAGIFNPMRPLFLADGSLLVVTSGDGSLRYDGSTADPLGMFIHEGFGGNLVGPRDFALSADGSSLFVADDQAALRRFNRWSGDFTENMVPPRTLPGNAHFALGQDNDFYVSDWFGNSVQRYDGESGALLGIFVSAGSGSLSRPGELTFGPDGHLYVLSGANNKVLKYNGATGSFLSEFVASGAGGLSSPTSIAFGPDGNLYVSSFEGDSVLRYDGLTGQFLGAFVTSGAGGIDGPTAFSFGPNDNLYAASSTNAVLEYDGQTGSFVGEFIPPSPGPGDTTALFFVAEATVPAVSTWGMLILTVLVTTAATLVLQKRSSLEGLTL